MVRLDFAEHFARAGSAHCVRVNCAETAKNFGTCFASLLAGRFGHASLQYYSLRKKRIEYASTGFA
jgi:hypothetical protein